MIYILAPFNLQINTTSRNRILTFYHTIKASGFEVCLVNPPLMQRDREIYLNGLIQSDSTIVDDSIKSIPLRPGFAEQVADYIVRRPNRKKLTAVINLIYLALRGKDLNYPSNSLINYFEGLNLSKKDLLIASAPPSALLSTAASIANKTGCKLVLDYRDPWTYGYKPIDSMPLINDIKKFKWRKSEDQCLETATFINCDSSSVKQLFPKKYHDKIHVILNGANLQAIDLTKIIDRFPVFRIIYLGTIYNDQLLDETFFEVAAAFADEKSITKERFEIIFVGSAKNEKLHGLIAKHRLKEVTTITERMPIEKAMKIAYTASVFLHLRYGSRTEVDTSKHLDYLALQKPVLLPVSDNGNVAEKILQDKAGYVSHNFQECYLALDDLWQKHQSGQSMRLTRNENFLYSISREAEAEKLVQIIKKHYKG